MKTADVKWGLISFERKMRTPEEMRKLIDEAIPIYFDTVKEGFMYIGYKLPRVRAGVYCGIDFTGTEYMMMKYVNGKPF